ncbi:MAG: hypothetical protein NTV01_00965 [Bacteroidia bacterium]|nr:hypothetical protein [Bacteroidia bacterium]
MWKLLKYFPVFLKYLINVGPVVYETAKWGFKIVREFRSKKQIKPKTEPPFPA